MTGRFDWEKQYKYKGTLKIDITILPKVICSANIDTHSIVLNANLFKYNIANYAHELAHLVLGVKFNKSLSEGLASYLSDQVGSDNGFNCGVDVHKVASRYIQDKEYQVIIDSIGIKNCPSPSRGSITIRDYTRAYYICSESFCTYLIDRYGMKKVLHFYESNLMSNGYKDIFGRTIEQLKSDWITYIKKYPEQLSNKEFDEIIKQHYKKHNFKLDS